MINYYICPKCRGEAADLDCYYCGGSGEDVDDDGLCIDCEECYGSGVADGEFECLECGHIYTTLDVE